MLDLVHTRRSIGKAFSALIAVVVMVTGLASVSHASDSIASETPLGNQPRVLDGRIYGIDSYGSTLLLGGTFTTIKDQATPSLAQANLFKFDVSTGLIDQTFQPQINGEVDAVAISDDGQFAYIVGAFSEVDGVVRRRIAKLDYSDGSLVTEFKANANGRMYDLALDDDKLFVSGKAVTIGGTPVGLLAALDLTTGDVLPAFTTVAFSGSRTSPQGPWISEIDLSNDGQWLVATGNFNEANGELREQVAVLEITATTTLLSDWFTDRYSPTCGPRYMYIRGVDIDPSGSYFVINTTGFHRGLDMMCDTAARFDLPSIEPTGTDQEPRWVTYTGGDTHWAVEITEAAVYVGGHQRWENNSYSTPLGKGGGPGAVERQGIAALDPLSGVPLSWNPTRTRGRGVEAMHVTDDYLFVGSDTERFADTPLERLAVLPFDPSWVNPAPVPVTLPASLHAVTGGSVDQFSFNGSSFGAATTISGPGIDGINWCQTDAAFAANGNLISFSVDDAYYQRSFDGAVLGASTNVSASVGYFDEVEITPFNQPFGVAEITAVAFEDGRIFYTRENSDKLHWRWYSLESGLISSQEWVANSSRDWSSTTGLAIMGGDLYVATAGNRLNRFTILDTHIEGGVDVEVGGTVLNTRGSVVTGPATLIDNGAAGIDWSSVSDLFAAPPTAAAPLVGSPTGCAGGGTPPTTGVSAPISGTVFGAGTVDLIGTATDNSAVDSVGVTVRDIDTGLYVQADGSMGATPVELPATVPGGGSSCSTKIEAESGTVSGALFVVNDTFVSGGAYIESTDLGRLNNPIDLADSVTYSFSVPRSADYTLDAIVQGMGTDSNGWYVQIDGGPLWIWDTIRPVGFSIDQVANRGGEDPVIANLAAGTHTLVVAMREDGSRLDRLDVTEVGCVPVVGSDEWTLQVTLPDGHYEAVAIAVDDDGDPDPTGASTTFFVDTTAPATTISTPANNSMVPTASLDVTGTTVDAVAVADVRMSLLDVVSGLFLQADGSFGPTRVWTSATLTTPDAATTTWSLPVTLPDGEYRAVVKAEDTVGNVEVAVRSNFTVEDVVVSSTPTSTLTSPTTFVAGPHAMAGTALDDTGIDRVVVTIRDRDTGLYLQDDGTMATNWNSFLAALASPGAAVTDWDLLVDISDPGRYRFVVKAFDIDGNPQAPTTSVNAVVS